MTYLKASTSKGKRVIGIYENLKGTTLSDLYKHPSNETIAVYEHLHSIYCDHVNNANGHSWKVTKRAGSWSWSCGWKYELDGHKYLRVETRDNTYIVDMEA